MKNFAIHIRLALLGAMIWGAVAACTPGAGAAGANTGGTEIADEQAGGPADSETGATETPSTDAAAIPGGELAGNHWILVEMPTADLNEGVPGPAIDGQITAGFEDGRLVGSAGCNGYFAEVEVNGDGLALGPIGRTMMACGEAIDGLENSYLSILQNVTGYRLDGRQLRLTDAAGQVVLVLEPAA